jgi:hypothetical protein
MCVCRSHRKKPKIESYNETDNNDDMAYLCAYNLQIVAPDFVYIYCRTVCVALCVRWCV